MTTPKAATAGSSDKAKAQRRLTSAKGKLTIVRNNREEFEVRFGRPVWDGERTPKWDRWVDLDNRYYSAVTKVANLEALLATVPDNYSSRYIGFDRDDMLEIDGAWVCNLDCNGQEMCIECTHDSLMAGEIHVDSCFSYLLSVSDPESSVSCSICEKKLYHVDEDSEVQEEA